MNIDENFPMPPRRKWPKYTKEEQELIATFLGAYMTEAQELLTVAKQNEAEDTVNLGATERAEFWKKAIQCIGWLGYRLKFKQRHLAILKVLREQEQENAKCGKP